MKKTEKTQEAGKTKHPPFDVKFLGTGKEYFGIWIVNLILTIITFGIYSAWAKVRSETYFKNNTRIFDSGFGYHATGGQIFKGRLIAVIVLVLVNVLTTVEPLFGVLLAPIFLILLPWILNSSLKFSARMTSFRNIRFNWHGTYWKTMWFLVISPLVGLLTLGLLTPLISRYYYSYFASSHSYGTTSFSSTPKIGQFYFAFLIGVIIPSIVIGCVAFTILAITTGSFGASSFLVMLLMFYAFLFSAVFIYPVLCRNLMMKSLTLGSTLTFDSKINPFKFIWISISNLFLTLLTLGLLLPWAKVRMYKYLSAMTFVTAIGDINEFIDEINSTRSSLGEAVSDLEGVEVAI